MNEDLKTKRAEIENSYLTKQEFIEMLNSIDFVSIKECSLELITGFIINFDNNEIRPLTKDIDIN